MKENSIPFRLNISNEGGKILLSINKFWSHCYMRSIFRVNFYFNGEIFGPLAGKVNRIFILIAHTINYIDLNVTRIKCG